MESKHTIMEQRAISFQNTAYFFIAIVLGIIILKNGQFFFGPLAFAALFSVMLQPVCSFYERLVKNRILSIFLTLLSAMIPLGIIITLVSIQFSAIIQNLPDITSNLGAGLERVLAWIKENLNMNQSELEDTIPRLVNNSMSFVQKGITSSTTFLFNAFFTLLMVFFLLWYRDSIRNFLLIQSNPERRKEHNEIIRKIQKTLQGYLYGLLIVILILAVLNSVGLLIIGIDYAIFWGVLAAFLAVIPYIGTTLGGTLPFLYALATADNWWQPVAVVGMYVVIQNVEGNIITPNIVGNSVSINPLVALLSIVLGGFIWGVSGIILAIPIAAVIKIIFEHNNRLKPLAFIMSNKVHKQDEKFWKKLDEDKYRMKK